MNHPSYGWYCVWVNPPSYVLYYPNQHMIVGCFPPPTYNQTLSLSNQIFPWDLVNNLYDRFLGTNNSILIHWLIYQVRWVSQDHFHCYQLTQLFFVINLFSSIHSECKPLSPIFEWKLKKIPYKCISFRWIELQTYLCWYLLTRITDLECWRLDRQPDILP